ncbi:hypothetical protein B0J11DRAFT_537591 [Dendryphion nanum]|uniref:BRCT domain-containing protein n=1 Tax=Dendryphion nanum TaxID=256645 RepID=A0A9P9DCT2_9PLEO|nr:hypothetical protein B0J11DRAFT_537591 [Dendryphion nanum]
MAPKKSTKATGGNESAQLLKDALAVIEKTLGKKVQAVLVGNTVSARDHRILEAMDLQVKSWDALVEDVGTEAGGEVDEPESEDDVKVEKKPKQPAKVKDTAKPKAKQPSKAAASTATSNSSVSGKTVLITGTVPGHDRKSAQTILEDAGATVAKSLNKQVQVAILGSNAGPDKLKKIEDEGIETITWDQLAKELDLDVPPEKEIVDVQAGDAPDSIDGKTVIITGTIEGHTRASASKILESAGAKIAKSLNSSVQLVVLGTKPGPEKLREIADANIPTASFTALAEKLDLDVGPPKKKAKTSS